MSDKNYFTLPIFNGSFLELLTDEQNGKLFKAIYTYEAENKITDFGKDEILKKVFDIFKDGLDFSEEQRLKRSEINRLNVSKRYIKDDQEKKEIEERILFLTGTRNKYSEYIKIYESIDDYTTVNDRILNKRKEKNIKEYKRIENKRDEKRTGSFSNERAPLIPSEKEFLNFLFENDISLPDPSFEYERLCSSNWMDKNNKPIKDWKKYLLKLKPSWK